MAVSKLSPEITTAAAEAVLGGLSTARASDLLGINQSTWTRWVQEGRANIDAGKLDTPHAKFAAATDDARRTAERRAILGILEAARGIETQATTTRTYTRIVGGEPVQMTETTTTTKTDRSWQAWAWWLERTFPEQYARVNRQWVSGPDGDPVEIAETRTEMARRAEAELTALAERFDVPETVDFN